MLKRADKHRTIFEIHMNESLRLKVKPTTYSETSATEKKTHILYVDKNSLLFINCIFNAHK